MKINYCKAPSDSIKRFLLALRGFRWCRGLRSVSFRGLTHTSLPSHAHGCAGTATWGREPGTWGKYAPAIGADVHEKRCKTWSTFGFAVHRNRIYSVFCKYIESARLGRAASWDPNPAWCSWCCHGLGTNVNSLSCLTQRNKKKLTPFFPLYLLMRMVALEKDGSNKEPEDNMIHFPKHCRKVYGQEKSLFRFVWKIFKKGEP